ncbi:YcxB family protein [Mangrovivirga sp. M17]|uniref:YcxB family protein n=1 Tax=Mangrovivirga halotolerans TaxID=2993936 RepID=A0ABT3RX84_9BACT|nr:YcxB family protein [Mangrovivirga halotolerans]MCX2746166.1 YcxB family protein [Mangrovivirga halotolerans]
MITINQTLSDKESKKAIAKHYFGYKYTLINPIIGLITILGIISIWILNSEILNYKFLVVFGLGIYLLLRPVIYIQNVFKSMNSNNKLSDDLKILIDADDRIITNIGENKSIFSIKDLYAYYEVKDFLFLYVSKNMYLIIKRDSVENSEYPELINVLKRHNIKKR